MRGRDFLLGAAAAAAFLEVLRHTNTSHAQIAYSPQHQQRHDTGATTLLRYGSPDRGPDVRLYSAHAVGYDQARRTPLWVAEHLTVDSVTGNANRKYCHFKPDTSVPSEFSAQNTDYKSSGWSRGHMAPAGDCKHSQDAMEETFFLSNIVPQDIDNNAGFWNRLEIWTRKLTNQWASVRVITGPLMMPKEEQGKRFIKYQVIGDNEVAVPTHLYKLVLVEDANETAHGLAAFVVPNEPIPSSNTLKQYQVPVESLERRAGMKFHPRLERSSLQDLCTIDSCKLVPQEELERYFLQKRLQDATTQHRLDKVWSEMSKKGIKPTPELTKIYNRKKMEIAEKDL